MCPRTTIGALTRFDTYSGPLLAALLIVPTVGLAAAPYNSYAAARASLPPQLDARRRSEWLRDRRTIVAGTTAGLASAVAVAALVAVVARLTAPSPHLVPPSLIGPERQPPAPDPALTVRPVDNQERRVRGGF